MKEATALAEMMPCVMAPKLTLPAVAAPEDKSFVALKDALFPALLVNVVQSMPSEFSRLSVTSQTYICKTIKGLCVRNSSRYWETRS